MLQELDGMLGVGLAAIFGLMIGNTVAISAYEYFVVNGIRNHYEAKKKRKGNSVHKGAIAMEHSPA